MATWGEFMREFKIVNQKGKVLVEADEVLDVWDDRNKLRKEVEELREQLAQERERCANDIDEFAQACAAEPDQPAYVVSVLEAASALIRQRGQAPAAEEGGDPAAGTEAAPMAEEVPMGEPIAGGEDIPMGEPIPEGEAVPAGEFVPTAEPLSDEQHRS
jgi:hypothetical protein